MDNKKLIVTKEGKSEATQTRLHARIQERLNQGWLKKKTQIAQTCKSHVAKKVTTLCQEEIVFALVVVKEILGE